MEFKEDLKKIQKGRNEMMKIHQDVSQSITRCMENKSKLDDSDLFDVMGDVFYPDNGKRLRAFKCSIDDLTNVLRKIKCLAYENQETLGCVENLIMTFEELSRMFRDMIPTLELQIALPKIFQSSDIAPAFFLASTGIATVGFGAAVIGGFLTAGVGLALFAFAEALLAIVGGVMRGAERRDMFENGRRDYDNKRGCMEREAYSQLQKLSVDLNEWFVSVAGKLQTSGLKGVSANNKPGMVKTLQAYSSKVKDTSSKYNLLLKLIKNKKYNLDKAMEILEIKMDDRKCMKLWYYYMERHHSIDRIARDVGLTNQEKNYYTVLLMLKDGRSSAAIAKKTKLPEAEIEEKRCMLARIRCGA